MYRLLRPVLFGLPPEAVHRLAMHTLKVATPVLPLMRPLFGVDDTRYARDMRRTTTMDAAA